MHTCHGCQGKIHSSVVCSSKCPKVDGHEEDNWCSQKCLQSNWPYGGNRNAMTYGGKKRTMGDGGSAAATSSPAQSRAGGIMSAGGRNSDFSRWQGDLSSMEAWHLEAQDIQVVYMHSSSPLRARIYCCSYSYSR